MILQQHTNPRAQCLLLNMTYITALKYLSGSRHVLCPLRSPVMTNRMSDLI